ncbi:MAG TPA: glycosyltransferase family 4 protein [Terriglobales bacterium]|nr:glycosyltransferase family 4 protein [Terriglobales bacterium]
MAPDNRNTEKRLKVGIVAPSLRYVGGQSVQADLLMRFWENDGAVESKFIAVDSPLRFGFRWAEKIRGVRTVFREPSYFWDLWRGLEDVDIAHVFSASYWSFHLAPAPAWFMAKLRSKKVLINYHSGEARDHLQRFRSARFVLTRADEIVVPSLYLVEVFREFGLHASVVPNVIDLSQFPYRERNPLRPHLVCTRGFSEYYSVDVVIKAFAEVQKEYPNAILDLVGDGPLEAELRKLAADLKLSNVNFTGVASRSEISRCYERADIFINASWLDNMPLSVIEAFGSGTPVVTTSPEAMPYLVEHGRTGLLSPVGDERALASNVVRLLREPAVAAALARNAHEDALKYSWKVVRDQWIKIYHALASKGGS